MRTWETQGYNCRMRKKLRMSSRERGEADRSRLAELEKRKKMVRVLSCAITYFTAVSQTWSIFASLGDVV
jgi:hypothetical protein